MHQGKINLALLTGLAGVLGGLGFGTRASSQGVATLPPPQDPATYKYFPSNKTNDGRFLAMAGGPTWKTLSGTKVSIGFAAPRISPWFEIAVFDGDTGKTSPVTRPDGTTVTQQVWDRGTQAMKYTLFADKNGLGNEADLIKIGEWDGNATNPVEGVSPTSGEVLWRTGNTATGPQAGMPNNDWFMINVINSVEAKNPVSGHYFYVLRIENPMPNLDAINSFKVRTTGTISVEAQAISLYAPISAGTSEEKIINPDWGKYPMNPFDLRNLDHTTYDGTWEFELDVPEATDFFAVWDGDADYGSFNRVYADVLDPDTPAGLPAWATSFAFPDSAAVANPFDDSNSPRFRRSNTALSYFSNTPGVPDKQEAIEYEVIAPDGTVYRNLNASGNQEWEQFRISANPAETRSTADYAPQVSADGTTTVPATGLPAGIYRIRVTGMDLENLNAYRFFHKSLGEDPNGNPVRSYRPYLTVGDTVFLDRNGNGRQDDPLAEPGIPGVRVEWYDGTGTGAVKDVAVTDAYGLYSFGGFTVREGDVYTVKLAPENFQSGGVLAGLTPTTTAPVPGSATVPTADGLAQTGTLGSVDLLDYDFGVIPPPVVSCPPSQTVTNESGKCSAAVSVGTAVSPQSPYVSISGARSDGQALSAVYPVGVTTITWTATNALGQTASCTQTITVTDGEAPVVSAPDVTVGLDPGKCTATVQPTATDNCTSTGQLTVTAVPAGPYGPGTTTVTWTVTDGAGNSTTTTQNVTVADKEAPALSCPAAVTVATDPDLCSATVPVTQVTATDNCGTATVTSVRSDGQALSAPFAKGVTQITWTATDASGNSTSCTQQVTVEDRQAPKITCPADVTVQAAAGQTSVTVSSLGEPTVTDNCPDPSAAGVRADGKALTDGYPVGTTLITWTATDTSGNTSSCTQKVTVNPPPTATNPGTGTIGYWKNHAWPLPFSSRIQGKKTVRVQIINVGGRDYTRDEALALFPGNGGKKSGDKSCDLFAQLVAAKLNGIIGNDTSCITADIAAADAWLASHPAGSGVASSSSAWSQIAAVHDRLDRYNNGLLCAPHRG